MRALRGSKCIAEPLAGNHVGLALSGGETALNKGAKEHVCNWKILASCRTEGKPRHVGTGAKGVMAPLRGSQE